jgi:hypothetical protein
MNATMAAGFAAGAGVDPARVKLVLLCVCAAAVLAIGVWIVGQLIEAYRSERVETTEVVTASVSLVVLLLMALLALTLT